VLNRVRGPFNVSSAALVAGLAAFNDTEHYARAKSHNEAWRAWLTEKLTALGLTVVPSVANFLLVRFPQEAGRDASAADAYLRGKGIIVRGMVGYGLGDSLRITIGNGEETEAVAEALAAFFADGPAG
jgi:histidinol-phosphate aminotransferase